MLNFISRWKDKATQYVDVRLQLAKLNLIDRVSHVLGYLMLSFIVLFVALAMLVFIGMGMDEAFSYWTDSRIAGGFLTALFFAILAGITVMLRNTIVNLFAGIFIRILTDPGDDKEEEDKSGKVQVK